MRRHIPHLAVATLLVAGALLAATAEAQFRLPFPAGAYGYVPESDLRVEVTPKDASVYVDGYFAGLVDEFDGALQRLHVTPGQHEITIYLQGYRTIREKLYLSPRGSRKIERTMERLAPGESSEPVPEPIEPPRAPAGPPPAAP